MEIIMNKDLNIGGLIVPESSRQTCEIWTRPSVMGYHRPVSQFNIGKKSEYKERKFFDEKKVIDEKKEVV
jgi:hypothetical protein